MKKYRQEKQSSWAESPGKRNYFRASKKKFFCLVIYIIPSWFGSLNNGLLREASSLIFHFGFLKLIIPKFWPGPLSSLVPSLLIFPPVEGWSCRAQVSPKATLSPPSAGQGRENKTKGSWVHQDRERSFTSSCHEQSRFELGKLIDYTSKSEHGNEKQNQVLKQLPHHPSLLPRLNFSPDLCIPTVVQGDEEWELKPPQVQDSSHCPLPRCGLPPMGHSPTLTSPTAPWSHKPCQAPAPAWASLSTSLQDQESAFQDTENKAKHFYCTQIISGVKVAIKCPATFIILWPLKYPSGKKKASHVSWYFKNISN